MWWTPCPAYGIGSGVETRIVCWVAKMDGGPYVVIYLDLCLIGGMRDRFAGMWAWLWL